MTKKDEDLLSRANDRHRLMVEHDSTNRNEALDDFKFSTIPGYQWEQYQKIERGKRPCWEFNKLRINGKKIINEIRANRPSGKVIGVEGGDEKTAEIMTGLVRNILNISDFKVIINTATEYQVFAGMGAWEVVTDYADDDIFDRDILVESIEDPFSLYADPSCVDPLKQDAKDWFYEIKVSKDEFKTRWPGKEVSSIESYGASSADYDDDENVIIGKYWYKKPIKKELWQLQDGKVIDASSDEAKLIPKDQIKEKRTVDTHKICMIVISGGEILEEPTVWPSKYFPYIQVYGEYFIVDGKHYWYGLPRWAKDPQRSYNVSRTAIAETIAMAPQAKFWATSKQAEGNIPFWRRAHKENLPYRIYNHDPNEPGPPRDSRGADVPVALIQETTIASKEIDEVTGIFADDRGQLSGSQSGRAIYARQEQGRLSTYNYPDNIHNAVTLTWRIIVDLIPKIYDTERELRVLGEDGAEDYAKINTFVYSESGEPIRVNDVTVGKYDVIVTSGPSFQNRRQEAAETYQALIQANPAIFPVAGDLIFKSMDLPYSDEIADRLKTMLPPEVKQMMEKDIPPEVAAAMSQVAQGAQQLQLQMQQAQEEARKLEVEKANNEKMKAELGRMMADIKRQEAEFRTKVAEMEAMLTDRQAKIDIASAQLSLDETLANKAAEERNNLEEGYRMFESAKSELGQYAQDILVAANATLMDMKEQATIAMEAKKRARKRPKVERVEYSRKDGKLIAVPIYLDEENVDPAEKIVRIEGKRVNGKIQAVPIYQS